MTIGNHLEHFAGFPVKDYDADVGIVLGGRIRRLEFQLVECTARKFWAIELDDTTHTVQFGRIGTAGQTQTKEFKTPEEARKAYEKLVHEKIKLTVAKDRRTVRARRIMCLTGRVHVILRVSSPFDPPSDHDPGRVGRVEAVHILEGLLQHLEDRGGVSYGTLLAHPQNVSAGQRRNRWGA